MQPALDYWITIIKGIVNKIPPKEIQLIDKMFLAIMHNALEYEQVTKVVRLLEFNLSIKDYEYPKEMKDKEKDQFYLNFLNEIKHRLQLLDQSLDKNTPSQAKPEPPQAKPEPSSAKPEPSPIVPSTLNHSFVLTCFDKNPHPLGDLIVALKEHLKAFSSMPSTQYNIYITGGYDRDNNLAEIEKNIGNIKSQSTYNIIFIYRGADKDTNFDIDPNKSGRQTYVNLNLQLNYKNNASYILKQDSITEIINEITVDITKKLTIKE